MIHSSLTHRDCSHTGQLFTEYDYATVEMTQGTKCLLCSCDDWSLGLLRTHTFRLPVIPWLGGGERDSLEQGG